MLGTEPSQDAIEGCDTLLMVGTSFPYVEFLPEPGSIECVQIDIDPQRISLRHPADVGLVGDAKNSLRALLPLLEKHDKAFLEKAQKGKAEWQKLMEERGTRGDKPMKPQVVGWELGKRIPPNAIVTSDSGTITTWWARYVPALRGQKHSCSGNLSTMACGLPYAIAAAVAYPDRPVYCIIGDGGLSMLLGELITVAAYKLNIKIIVIKNNTRWGRSSGSKWSFWEIPSMLAICILPTSLQTREVQESMQSKSKTRRLVGFSWIVPSEVPGRSSSKPLSINSRRLSGENQGLSGSQARGSSYPRRA